MGIAVGACASTSSIRSAPMTAGSSRTFAASAQDVSRAAREALAEAELQIEDIQDLNDSTRIIVASKPTSNFSWGELVRVAITSHAGRGTEVAVFTQKKLATNVAAKGDYSGTIFSRIAVKLEDASYADREMSPKAPTVPSPSVGRPSLAATGSAFFISLDGYLLTNAHVVDGCTDVRLKGEGRSVRVIQRDMTNDLALLKSEFRPQTAARFRSGRTVRSGDVAIVVGFPLSGLLATEANVTVGGVSALAGLGDDFRFLQITAPVQPGNSGGPLLDISGNVIGVVTSKLNALSIARITGDVPQNINFAVNGSVARLFLDGVGIAYVASPSEEKLEPAEVGERAKRFTVMVECLR